MSQQLGRFEDMDHSSDAGFAPAASGVRPVAASAEPAFFQLNVRRSLQLHWQLARAVALGGAVLAVVYLLVQVFVLKAWPAYLAQSIVYVQPTPSKVLESPGVPPRWPFDSNTYETYIQQQMLDVSRADVLAGALHKLNGFQEPGESDQAAARRLVKKLEVARQGATYQFSIGARANDPAMAAQIANAVTASYIESTTRDERSGDAERLSMLREERDRIQNALAADRTEQDALNKQLGVAAVSATAPDHYDADITQIRADLMKARTDHDAAEARFNSLDAGHGPSSAAIDAEADQMIASDAGLVSMKTALNARRSTLISQMANLTPLNPQYKQDEAELMKINNTLDAMLKDLRAKAAAHIQMQLRTELERTGAMEAQLNGQLRRLVGTAGGATPKLQRSSDLAADVTRLQARFATVDEQLHNLLLEANAPVAAYQATPAVAPIYRAKSGVLRNAALIVLAGLLLGILAAVTAHKLDPRIYIASDVERILGFAPLAQLPDFSEVSDAAAEEYLLRLASAIEHGRKQGSMKNCVFTGTGPGAGVTTLVNRIRKMLEAMGRPTLLVDATGAPGPASHAGSNGQEDAQGLVPVERVSRSTALLQQMVEETGEDSLVLADTAPLAVSAETEYLARFVDSVILVIESGVTTRAQLREAASTLQRLHPGAVGFVLNRVGLAKADPAFRQSIEAVEKHVQAQSDNAARRAEKGNSSAPNTPADRDAPPGAPSIRSMFEPEVAAAAAAVARVSAPAAPRHADEAAAAEPGQRIAAPEVVAAAAENAKTVSSAAHGAPAEPAPAAAVATPKGASEATQAVGQEPEVSAVAGEPLPIRQERAMEAEPMQPAANPAADVPWWLSEAVRTTEPSRPPVLWQPAKVWNARGTAPAGEPLPVGPNANPEPQQPWESGAEAQQMPRPEAAAEETQGSGAEEAPSNLNSRLSGLRNLLYAMGVKNANDGGNSAGQAGGAGSDYDLRTERASFERGGPQTPVDAASGMRGAAPQLVTAPPEFLPPRPVVIEIDKTDPHTGESSTRQDRRTPYDRVDILPSKRGQYKKV